MKWINLAHDRKQWRFHINMVRLFFFFTSEQLTVSKEGLRCCSFLQLLIGYFLSISFLKLVLDYQTRHWLPALPCLCVWVSVSGRLSRDGPVPKWPIYGCLKAQVPLVWCYRNVPLYRFPSKLPSHVVHGLAVWTSSTGIPLFINTHIWTGNARRFWRT